uniref:Uncharacterized protein n=1 Tax=Setaria italica TaxID=4555 RepID=K4A3I4_SETIT
MHSQSLTASQGTRPSSCIMPPIACWYLLQSALAMMVFDKMPTRDVISWNIS